MARCLMLSAGLHASAFMAGSFMDPGEATAAVILLETGEVALEILDFGGPVDSAPSPARPSHSAAMAEPLPRVPPAALRPTPATPLPVPATLPAEPPSRPWDVFPEMAMRERLSPPVSFSTPLERPDPAREAEAVRFREDRPPRPQALDAPPAPPDPEPSSARAPSVAMKAGADRQERGVLQRARPQGGFAVRYPEASRRRGESGVALVAATIDAAGRCVSAAIERSSGYPALDAAALAAVRGARFAPARQGSSAVAAHDRFEIVFQLTR